ncbi:hypothetical protein B566_EDAN007437 [Ephemera danica]|nr:hypothetical protein B566_EDAN007437 [Ephemera danica]
MGGVIVALLAAASHAAISKGNAGWNDDPLTQYHIQTDEGPERYFRYQTTSGQYRKEKRLEDGTVIGTYGWVDPTGMLLLRDYIADNAGYRIVRTKKVFVGVGDDAKSETAKPAAPVYSPPTPEVPTVVQYNPPTPEVPTVVQYNPPAPVVSTPAVYPTSAPTYVTSPNLYDHPANSPVKPQAANFNSHPYYSDYEPVIGFQKKPAFQKLQVYPSSNYPLYDNIGKTSYQKPLQTVRVFTPEQQSYNEKLQQIQNYGNKIRLDAEYDGVSTTQNGFRYYLPRQYHEEENSGASDRAGSFGYIDPFGIRRVTYYNTSPGSGFQVKKNNRYVGFNATPYDPRF